MNEQMDAIRAQLAERIVELERTNARYRLALRFYARGKHVVDDYGVLEVPSGEAYACLPEPKEIEEGDLDGLHVEMGDMATWALTDKGDGRREMTDEEMKEAGMLDPIEGEAS